ncbi:hypothetical protein DY218_01185 [Streptomyces triticagri]|uniref:Uncharacterized protein n=1 Tax=Streptomyces triticagri TaxID=2293568 RepID=A0A372MC41_9ACTN|nr:hypothetical protein DY218_01185 [Streptomyces triticagri]
MGCGDCHLVTKLVGATFSIQLTSSMSEFIGSEVRLADKILELITCSRERHQIIAVELTFQFLLSSQLVPLPACTIGEHR